MDPGTTMRPSVRFAVGLLTWCAVVPAVSARADEGMWLFNAHFGITPEAVAAAARDALAPA